MKKFILTVLFVFSNASASLAQERIISESEFNEILSGTAERLKTVNYRLTKTEELFLKTGEKPERVKIQIEEILLPNKWREIVEEKSKEKAAKTERIWDGSNLYVRENNGKWMKFDGGSGFGGGIQSGRFTKTFRFVEKSRLDDKIANIYDVEIRRVANKMTQTSMYQVTYVEKTRYWISEDNFLLKKKIENTTAGAEGLLLENSVYEYDPKDLKIEAPLK